MDDTRQINWTQIEDFIGFGRPDAPVVFIGMEEGLTADADINEDLQLRSAYGAYTDLGAGERLGAASKYFGPKPVTQRTWRPMCHLMLRREGVSAPSTAQRTRYQAERLGRQDGDTLLAELMPYPCHDRESWPYASISPYHSRFAYTAAVRPKRIKILSEVLTKHTPDLVVCYGRDDWRYFELLFQVTAWRDQYPFKVATAGKTRVLLSPHFSSRAFNTDVQLNNFADIALNASL